MKSWSVCFMVLVTLPLWRCAAGEPVPPAPLEEKVKAAQIIVVAKASDIVAVPRKKNERSSGEFSMRLEVSEVLFPPHFVPSAPWKVKILQSPRRTSDARDTFKEGDSMIFLLSQPYDDKSIYSGPVDESVIAYPLANRDRIKELLQRRAMTGKEVGR